MGVSCDSFDERTNELIGRGAGENVQQLFRIRGWCRELVLNWQEDMAAIIQELQPFRWKCFKVLFIEDENDASTADTALDKRKRDARKLLISSEQFDEFYRNHQHLDAFVPEPNDLMASSYLILDEYLCFLDKGSGKERQSRSIREWLKRWKRSGLTKKHSSKGVVCMIGPRRRPVEAADRGFRRSLSGRSSLPWPVASHWHGMHKTRMGGFERPRVVDCLRGSRHSSRRLQSVSFHWHRMHKTPIDVFDISLAAQENKHHSKT